MGSTIDIIADCQMYIILKNHSQMMFQNLIEWSGIEEQFYYYYEIHSSPQQKQNQIIDHQWLGQMESQTDGQEKNDLFSEPNYIRRPFIKALQNSSGYKVQPLPAINVLHANPMSQTVQKLQKKQQVKVGKKAISSSQDDEELSSPHKMGKKINKKISKKKEKREQYPTKNFLPSFRSSFINYLAAHFEQNKDYFENFQIIRRIRGKPCINLTDYEDLFKVPQFRPILKIYFKDRVIVRDLMQSRIQYETKLVYFRKIHVFEQAFESGVFKRIN